MKILDRLIIFFIIFIVIARPLPCQTHISGDISKFKLDSLNNPFIIDENIEIPLEKKVVIGEGCIFLFKMYTGLTIRGSLSVEGTSTHPVVFTSINDTMSNKHSSQNVDAFDWNGVIVDQRAGNVILKDFQLSYSVYGIKSQKSEVIIQNGVFHSNGQFNFTLFEKIMDVQDNMPYTFPSNNETTQIKHGNTIDKKSLRIESYPAAAEVYVNKKPGKRISPNAKTPATIKRLDDLSVSVTLFKKNYADTTFIFELKEKSVNKLNITLSKIRPEAVNAQNRLLHERSQVSIGKVCIISSPLFLLGGAGLVYLSEKNRQKADDARIYLERTIIQHGSKYETMQKQYKDESNKGNAKLFSGIALLGVAAVDLGIGFIMYF